jgi:hypothetical protein
MKRKYVYLTIAFFIVLFSCSKDKDEDTNGDEFEFNETCNPTSFPGLQISIDGDVSDEIDPMSEGFNDYIECMQNCAQSSPDNPQCLMDCMSVLGVLPAGAPFSISVQVTNITAFEIVYIVEPGDWFEPASGGDQPMMSPISITEVVVPGETITITIPVYCLASDLAAPDEDSDYSMCEMIASSGCLKDIVEILETKNMSSIDYAKAMEVQQIIWNCTEGEEVDWEYLNNLPAL